MALLIRSKCKLAVAKHGTFWLSKTPDKPGSKDWDANITRICTWALLVSRANADTFYVYNTHFDHKGVIARKHSAELLCDTINAHASLYPYIVTGDFNIVDTVQAYSTITNCIAGIADTYREKLPDNITHGTAPGFTVGERIGNRIDYIFRSKDFSTLLTRIPADNDGTYYPSDHLPYQAYLLFKQH